MKNTRRYRMLSVVIFVISLICFQSVGFAQSLIDTDTLLGVAEEYKNILYSEHENIAISLQASDRKANEKELTSEKPDLEDVYTFYDLNGIPSAYVYTILSEDNKVGYIAISATREHHPLLSSSSHSHPMNNFEKCMKIACTIDLSICENPNEYMPVYLGMFYYYFVFNPNSDNPVVVEAMTESTVPYNILLSMQEKYDLSKERSATDAAKSWKKREETIRQQSITTAQTTSTISNVPKYNWYRGCTTSSATMVLSYYGLKGFNGLSEKPDSFSWTRPKNWMFYWLIGECDSSSTEIYIPKDLADEVADRLRIPEDCGFFSTDWGATANEQAQAMKTVAGNHGYSFNAAVLSASSISTYMSEIDANRPVVIHYDTLAHESRSGKHSATGYGYTKLSDIEHILYVNNTWFTDSIGIDSFTYENAFKAGYINKFISFVSSKPLASTLRIDGGTSSTKSQGGTFSCTGSNYTHNRSVTRYLKQPNGTTIILSPTLYADSSGNISWSYTSNCSTPTGTYYLWVKDDATGNISNTVTEIVTANSSCSTPITPSSLSQYKSDGTTSISFGGTTNQSTVVLRGKVGDPTGKTVKLQIELRRLDEYGGGFTGTYTQQSGDMSSGTTANIKVYGLINGKYHWRARTVNSAGAASSWVSVGGNSDSSADFTVAVPSTLLINGGTSSTKSQGGTFICTGSNYTPNGSVTRYMKKPDGSMVTLTPILYANSSGSISWSFTSTCATTVGTSTLWIKDNATGRISNTVTQTVKVNTSCPVTLLINGSSSSTRQQGGTFVCTGTNYTPNGSTTRYMKKPDGSTITLTPTLYANSSGNISWSYTSICTTPIGTHYLWVKDNATGRYSNTVSEIVTRNYGCP